MTKFIKLDSNLEWIRLAFPNYPSEHEQACNPINWGLLAQQYYCAARVLLEEQSEFHNSGGQELTEQILIRKETSNPALLCIALALELAVKGAYVAQPDVDITPNEKLSFSGHSVINLCDKIQDIELTDDDEITLLTSEQIVLNGKYPTRLRPSDERTSLHLPYPHVFLKSVERLYLRLMETIEHSQ